MAILKKEQYFEAIKNRLGDDSSDEAIQFMEDMTDTYNDLENRATEDSENWEQKYKENDAAWKKRYANRFFNGSTQYNNGQENLDNDEEEQYNPESVTIDSLFNGGKK